MPRALGACNADHEDAQERNDRSNATLLSKSLWMPGWQDVPNETIPKFSGTG